MTDFYKIQWVGWDNSFEHGTQHDKIWGWLTMRDGREFCFWGKRGKKLKFKEHPSTDSIRKKMREKENGSYKFVPSVDYDALVKDFLDEVEVWCMTAILEEKVM